VSATEVIEQIRVLPPHEKAQVIDFIAELQKIQPAVRYATDEQFKQAADEVFKKHSELLRSLAS
jgi:hypothetical protein